MNEAALSDAAARAQEERQEDLRCFLADYAIREGDDFDVRGVRYRCGQFDPGRVRWSVRPVGVRSDLAGAEAETIVEFLTTHLLREGSAFTLRRIVYRVGKYNPAKNRYHLTCEGVEEDAFEPKAHEGDAPEAHGRGVPGDCGPVEGPSVSTLLGGVGSAGGGGCNGTAESESVP